MSDGDFAHNEKSTTIKGATHIRIVHTDADGQAVSYTHLTLPTKA